MFRINQKLNSNALILQHNIFTFDFLTYVLRASISIFLSTIRVYKIWHGFATCPESKSKVLVLQPQYRLILKRFSRGLNKQVFVFLESLGLFL